MNLDSVKMEEQLTKEVLQSIESQKGDSRDDEVYVIEIMSIRFQKFNQRIKNSLERFTSLQMLTINDCLLSDLSEFPHIPSLIRLDLVFNQIEGSHLQYLRGSRHLQTLMLGANRIEHIEDLLILQHMKQLFQLDLLNNPIVQSDDYREQIFKIFPSLQVLDTLDKKGLDIEKANLDISAARIPSNLFDRSPNKYPQQPQQPFAPFQRKQPAPPRIPKIKITPMKLNAAKQPAGVVNVPLVGTNVAVVGANVPVPVISRKGGIPRKSSVFSKKSSPYNRGLVFPCSRIRRYLKQTCRESRISSTSGIYLAAVLEFLAAEVLELAGNFAKDNRMKRITPLHIRTVFRNDKEFNQFMDGTIIAETGSTTTHFQLPQFNK